MRLLEHRPWKEKLPQLSAWALFACTLAACGGKDVQATGIARPARGLSDGRDLGPLLAGRRLTLPLTSRSEIVPRGEIQSTGFGPEDRPEACFQVRTVNGTSAGTARALVIEHPTDQQVLATEQGWFQTGPPLLARSIEPQASSLLARQDGHCASGTLRVTAPPCASGVTLWLVILSGSKMQESLHLDDQELQMPAAPRGALVVPWSGLQAFEIKTSGPIDQIYFCEQAQEVGHLAAWQEVSFKTDALHVPLPEEPNQELTMTLLLEILEAPMGFPADPRGTSTSPCPALRDVASEAGLQMVHLEGPDLQLDIRPTMGPGAAWGDFDGDGWLDLFLPQGAGRPEQDPLLHRLFKNQGDGTFEDISFDAGLGGGDASMGALAFDANGDGKLDLYLACQGRDRFFLGKGDGTFKDASDLLPPSDLWSASVCAADYDGDGDLDLYITRYLEYDPGQLPPDSEGASMRREDPLPMLPYLFRGQPNQLLRNDLAGGVLAFSDVAEKLGVHDPKTQRVGKEAQDSPGLGMQAIWWDFDRDGDQDLYVANDVTPNVLYENNGKGGFREVTLEAGLDDPRGGMGLAIGDLERDGDEDLLLTNWELESNALYLNLRERRFSGRTRRPRFRDAAIAKGLARSSIGVTSWGPVLFDLELDGDLDLFVANGYTSPDYSSTGICVGQADHLYVAQTDGTFVEMSDTQMEKKALPAASRGAIACDYDQDGDEDLLVTTNNGAVRLLRNDSKRAKGHTSIRIRLKGKGANTQGIGAEVTLSTANGRYRRSLRAGEGYLTGGPGELVFGLGACKGPIDAHVRWPSGTETEHTELLVGGLVVLSEE